MWEKEEKILGVIGGMGPEATQLFYRMVIDHTDAHSDQEHLNMILLNHASMPDRTEAILRGKTDVVSGYLLEDARRLEKQGCAAIAIPCNTSHYFAESIQKAVSIPLIHMPRETAKVLKERGVKRVGLLATDGTVQTGVYTAELKNAGMETVLPSADGQRKVMKIIYDGIKNGGAIDCAGFRQVEKELLDHGAEAIVLGCTELSVYRERYQLSDLYVDAMEVLAKASIRACGKPVK